MENHPLVSFILSFIQLKRKNLERGALSSFYKNPLFFEDKQKADEFENYCVKYNVNYSKIKQPFTVIDNKKDFDLDSLESMRKEVVSALEIEDVSLLLKKLSVKEKLEAYTIKLKEVGLLIEAAVNEQIYQAVEKILEEIRGLAKDGYKEIKHVMFLGGSSTAIHTIKNMPKTMTAKVFETDPKRVEELADIFLEEIDEGLVTILQADGRDMNLRE